MAQGYVGRVSVELDNRGRLELGYRARQIVLKIVDYTGTVSPGHLNGKVFRLVVHQGGIVKTTIALLGLINWYIGKEIVGIIQA